jgi:hypothetical protein
MEWINSSGVRLVFADAGFIPLIVARRCNVAAFAMSNFLWDSIYDALILGDLVQ